MNHLYVAPQGSRAWRLALIMPTSCTVSRKRRDVPDAAPVEKLYDRGNEEEGKKPVTTDS